MHHFWLQVMHSNGICRNWSLVEINSLLRNEKLTLAAVNKCSAVNAMDLLIVPKFFSLYTIKLYKLNLNYYYYFLDNLPKLEVTLKPDYD